MDVFHDVEVVYLLIGGEGPDLVTPSSIGADQLNFNETLALIWRCHVTGLFSSTFRALNFDSGQSWIMHQGSLSFCCDGA